jgi:DNA anti-recombination protein RmuC
MKNGCRPVSAQRADEGELKDVVRQLMEEVARCREDFGACKAHLAQMQKRLDTELAEHEESIQRVDAWLETLQDGQDRIFQTWDRLSAMMRPQQGSS